MMFVREARLWLAMGFFIHQVEALPNARICRVSRQTYLADKTMKVIR